MLVILNYGMGNLGSLVNMFKRVEADSVVTSDIEIIKQASRIVLPGVGAFDSAMQSINSIKGLRKILDYKAKDEKVPIIGVCLGMQLLTSGSEEGKESGLGWIKGKAFKFPKSNKLKVPHMGWNISIPQKKSELVKGILDAPRYYFVHSYYVLANSPKDALMVTTYGIKFHSAISNENIFGVQFHPEKSHRFGMQILKNFMEL